MELRSPASATPSPLPPATECSSHPQAGRAMSRVGLELRPESKAHPRWSPGSRAAIPRVTQCVYGTRGRH